MKAITTSTNDRPKQITRRKPVVLNRERKVITSHTTTIVPTATAVNDDPTVRSLVWTAQVLNTEHQTVEDDYPVMSDAYQVQVGQDDEETKKECAKAYLNKLEPLCSTDSINLLKESIKDGTMKIEVSIKENLH